MTIHCLRYAIMVVSLGCSCFSCLIDELELTSSLGSGTNYMGSRLSHGSLRGKDKSKPRNH
eukprot:6160288-Amphidinium_carterae.2